jgi:hypothetical protein
MIQTLIVGVIILGCAGWLAVQGWRRVSARKDCGCGSCPKAGK